MAKHLVWDWNGTLLDDFGAIVIATNTAVATMDGEQLPPDAHRKRFRRPVIDFYSELIGRRLAETEFATLNSLFHSVYLENLDGCPLSTGARQVLAEWPGSQSLLSMWMHEALVPLVDSYGLTSNFARVDGKQDSVSDHKHPYLEAHLEAMEVDAADCVLIGDTVDDFHAASQAGAQAVLYSRGFSDAEVLRATGAPVADSLAEAVELARTV